MKHRISRFLIQNGSVLLPLAVFLAVYIIGGRLYPTMQKPQVFFNLFINDSSLLLVSIGMTLVILTGGIDLSVGGVIALVTSASAVMLRSGVSAYIVMPLMTLDQ